MTKGGSVRGAPGVEGEALRAGARAHRVEVARVVLVPPWGRLAALDYRVSQDCGPVRAGMRVLVPLGSRRSMGVILEIVTEGVHYERLRDIIAALDTEPVFDGVMLQLIRWMADYYLAPLSEAVTTALPGVLRVETERLVTMHREVGDVGRFTRIDREILALLTPGQPQRIGALGKRLGPGVQRAIVRLRRRGAVRILERLRREVAPTRYVRFWEVTTRVNGDDVRLARRPALGALYGYLREHPLGRATIQELRNSFPNALPKLRDLAATGLVRCCEEETFRSVLPPARSHDRAVTLTGAQHGAVEQITAAMAHGFSPFLLWGVTGSGKTEVYLRAVATTRAAGKTALILVPEISLTHQIVDRVRARFGEQVAVLHSQLTAGERWDEWRRIARGDAAIVIGARSAVFAPLRRPGIIIVDEEHDPAYKQADGVHYHGRDVAVMRAKMADCPLVLGSATPSLESFANAQAGRYRLLELPERVEARPLPKVQLIDLRGAPPRAPALSPVLAAAIEANVAAGGQSLLFLNRRGFANFLQCRACGDPVMCPNCSVTLTWHRQSRALRCHYCDHTAPPPMQCGTCGEPSLDARGIGTEQLESILREAFPGVRIGRMDRDTTRRTGRQIPVLHQWAGGGLDILIGTQMVAKGHDVPGVTLVGVLFADMSLNFPDFRAAERTFQLLAQVAGRAGRGDRPGRVIIQTLQPEHISVRAAGHHDFARFARDEMAARRELGYPPFARLVMLRLEGERLADVTGVAADVAARLREVAAGRFAVLGPAPAPIERVRRRHRYQILVRGRRGPVLRQAVAEVMEIVRPNARSRAVRVVADVDPYHML